MTDTDTITLTRAQYEALIAEKETLEDQIAALDADDGSRIPHEVALAIMQGERPIVAFRTHLSVTVRDLAARTGNRPGLPVRDRTRAQARLCSRAVTHCRGPWDDD